MKIDDAIEELKQYFEQMPEMHFYDASALTQSTVMVAIEALQLQKKFDDGFFIPKDYHDKVYEKLFERYTKALESQRWIPASKRLPEASDSDGHGKVLVHFSNGHIDIWHWEIVQTNFVSDLLPVLTHWMPLPEPPQEV